MKTDELVEYINCIEENGRVRVRSRERADLEFKQSVDINSIRKCIKTVAAFANTVGGSIVFGVTDSPRFICGIDPNEWPDESELQNLLVNYLVPLPEFSVIEHEISGNSLIELRIEQASQQPVIASKELQTVEQRNRTVLQKGVVYYRRAGQSRPITGEEFTALISRRDDKIRGTILNFIMRGNQMGFENAVVADFREYGNRDENVTLYVPSESAKELNIIDRARLVESDGAPAYEIRGSIALTSASNKDPRKPSLPNVAVRSLRPEIEKIFGSDFPWSPSHLRLAAKHLGFWSNPEGDNRNTGQIEINKQPVYYELGRKAVLNFARSSPDEFVEVVGSRDTKAKWKRKKADEDAAAAAIQK